MESIYPMALMMMWMGLYPFPCQYRIEGKVAQASHSKTTLKFCSRNVVSVRYARTPRTESKSKPDFIFPGIEEYGDLEYDPLHLTMLGVKSSCKDRWRQVLAEADRIEKKHLLTLEAAISETQTDEMRSKKLQLVLPNELHDTYSEAQQSWIINVSQFTEHARQRQP